MEVVSDMGDLAVSGPLRCGPPPTSNRTTGRRDMAERPFFRRTFGERPRIDPVRSGYRRVMTAQLQDRRIAFLTANEGVEQIELTEPWEAVKRAGGTPVLVAPQVGKVQAFNHLDKADTFEASISAGDADAGDYDGLVLPGGVANPDQLRAEPDAVRFVKD